MYITNKKQKTKKNLLILVETHASIVTKNGKYYIDREIFHSGYLQ